MNRLLIGLLIIAGVFSAQSYALDLGKVLEDAAKQEIDKQVSDIKGDEKAPAANPPQLKLLQRQPLLPAHRQQQSQQKLQSQLNRQSNPNKRLTGKNPVVMKKF